jgi:hypothetical protein
MRTYLKAERRAGTKSRPQEKPPLKKKKRNRRETNNEEKRERKGNEVIPDKA